MTGIFVQGYSGSVGEEVAVEVLHVSVVGDMLVCYRHLSPADA